MGDIMATPQTTSLYQIVTLDDEIYLTRALARILHASDRQILQYQSGMDVLANLQDHKIAPHLFITDIDMGRNISG